MNDGVMPWGMGIGALVVLMFWIFVIAGIALLVVWVAGRALGGGAGRGVESALEILKKRYARGEISKAEYEEKKKDLASP